MTAQTTLNLLKRVYLPICLPQIAVVDYGRVLEEIFLAAAERAYKAQYPKWECGNHWKNQLMGWVNVVEESRHHRLIAKMTQGPVVLIHFPNPMQGFSIPADLKMISAFPMGFMLSGALDTAASFVGHTATFTINCLTPALDCAANTWQGSSLYQDGSLCFETGDGRPLLRDRGLCAFGSSSGGLSFVG